MAEDERTPQGQAWSILDDDTEWWPALAGRFGAGSDDDEVHEHHSLTHSVPGGMDRVRSTRRPLNAQRVPPGVHDDVDHPIPVTATMRWETGDEEHETNAVEWWSVGGSTVVRVQIADHRVMTGAVRLPLEDVRRR